MTQTPKMVTRRVAIAFAILCVVTLVALNLSIITNLSQLSTKNKEIQTLNDQIDTIKKQIANITLPKGGPKLVSIDIQYSDNRTDPSAPFLQLTGYVFNEGSAKANNCFIHISAIQNGNNTAIEASAPIEFLEAGAYQKIDIQLPYSGQPLLAFSSNLLWSP